MVTVKCITTFHDLTDEVMRNPGDQWNCTKERGDMLNGRRLVEIIADEEVIQPEENKVLKPVYKKK